MANKIKKVSINKLEEAVNSQYKATTIVDWNGLNITINRILSLKSMMTFVDSVIKNCFGKEDGEYRPEVKDFAVRNCIIKHYTNISLPSNIEKRYDLLYRSDLLNTVMNNIDQSQFSAMVRAIEEKLSHLAQANIEAINRQMNELYTSFANLGKQLSGVDAEALNGVMNALSNGKIDETKIVREVMNYKDKTGV